MTGYQIGPFDEPSVPEIAAFLIQSLGPAANARSSSGGDGRLTLDRSGSTHDYRWLLDEDNPARSEGIPAGEVIRNDQGRVVGMIGCHPVFFRLGDRRLLGLEGSTTSSSIHRRGCRGSSCSGDTSTIPRLISVIPRPAVPT